jgi:hypothetical protein
MMRRVQICCLVLVLIVAIIPDGGVDIISRSIVAILSSVLCVTLIWKEMPPTLRMISKVTQALIGILTLDIVFQSWRFENNPFQNPVWATLRQAVPTAVGAISVAPEQSLSSIVSLAPLVTFLAAMFICAELAVAVSMVRLSLYISSFAAVIGLANYVHLADWLTLTEKQFYLDSLTSFFVNRNTAGTFFGLGSLASFALFSFEMRGKNITQVIFNEQLQLRQIFGSNQLTSFFFLMLNGISLALTQSRGAILATGIALLVFLLIIFLGRNNDRSKVSSNRWLKRVVSAALAILAMLFVFQLFGARVSTPV